jgi:uncharacterized protein (DUF2336 family)
VEAADALARAFLHSPLDEGGRRKVLTGLFGLVDDGAVAVRERLADVFADRRDAPRAIVLRLLDDVPSVSATLYARSPLLMTRHLLDGLSRADARVAMAIAERMELPGEVVAQLMAEAAYPACHTLIANPYIRLSSTLIDVYIERFGGDGQAMDALQAYRQLSVEQSCSLVCARADALGSNAFVQALVPGKRLARLASMARERAMLEMMVRFDASACWKAMGSIYHQGAITPAFVVRAALCGRLNVLEAIVGHLTNVSQARVRATFVHPRPPVAAALLKKTRLSPAVQDVVAMALVLARELARAEVRWSDAFFAEALIEVIDHQGRDAAFSETATSAWKSGDALALCHDILADVLQAEARSDARRTAIVSGDEADDMIEDAVMVELAA